LEIFLVSKLGDSKSSIRGESLNISVLLVLNHILKNMSTTKSNAFKLVF